MVVIAAEDCQLDFFPYGGSLLLQWAVLTAKSILVVVQTSSAAVERVISVL